MNVRRAILCLLALRILACCYAWDRLPLLPTYDEAIINDPAVAMSRDFGLVAFSYSGIPIADRYAHFPPLFMFLQAATFRVFGFSALTLRFWPVALEIAGNAPRSTGSVTNGLSNYPNLIIKFSPNRACTRPKNRYNPPTCSRRAQVCIRRNGPDGHSSNRAVASSFSHMEKDGNRRPHFAIALFGAFRRTGGVGR